MFHHFQCCTKHTTFSDLSLHLNSPPKVMPKTVDLMHMNGENDMTSVHFTAWKVCSSQSPYVHVPHTISQLQIFHEDWS